MIATRAKWAERVRSWRASGKTAEEFAAGLDFEASTLRYWASRLKTEGTGGAKAPSIVRVVRRRRRPASRVREAEVPMPLSVDVVVGAARIVVRSGFDAELLRQVVAALGSVR